ncbi:MAG TPA: choice-of-anchor V domain-containing protein, partial [Blastocatellia bacterium]|nr:choice-of-anchor V domain-containing protein [Blastocatellia bacterium]
DQRVERVEMLMAHYKQKIQTLVLVLFVTAVAYAKVTGPDPGYTNAPGDLGVCTACHDKPSEFPNVGPGSIRLANLPAVYTPGQQYTLAVTVQQAGRVRFGFQLTALDANGTRAGTLEPVDSASWLNPDTGAGGRQYIEHTQLGTLAPVQGSRTWQIRWTAPSTDIGTVSFWMAGNASNNDGTPDGVGGGGDYIYTDRVSADSPTSVVTVALQSNLTGVVLAAGSHQMINWAVTGPSNIDNVELRYSTDDGATFPITNLILSTTNPATTSHDWTVPNTPTTRAKLRIMVGKKSGDAVQVLSGTFTITGDGTAPLPTITGANIKGKKLFVLGNNFAMGAVVDINGSEVATVNDDADPAGFLRCKKGGKKIAQGTTATLVVRNPNGTASAPFNIFRPFE